MRYLLTLYGVPAGRFGLPDPATARCACRLEPLPGFIESGVAAHALQIGEWIGLTHGPQPRASPRQRRMGAVLRMTRPRWRSRLGILDRWGVHVPAASVEVIWFPGRDPLVFLDFRYALGEVGARRRSRIIAGGNVVVPAA